ncbi:prepilin-type N-terminal cleavage/methylation domain-containing protein [Frondihabitans sp. PhB188]|uniref:type IV pilus modification PilV family protein n=1 Tax=Frondihabitans sp. PhB188 TaxID=2485200 RepID=UPI000F479641|nr:prepilin-type N-terminal cleavage/methylation domain-containing protein [Frondihabitans sp. PhB188]ROQ37385.1 prepilin-type N-terminal cleavage/methylation domain-containing protein [Frondihabitans sp. PhB188]
MIALIARLRRTRIAGDAGMTLIEVIIALTIFAVITVGAITAIGTALIMTRDNRSREVAANLASQTIDSARNTTDIFALASSKQKFTLSGTTYTVTQAVAWVTTAGVDSLCTTAANKGNGALFYKHVNVTVSWSSQKSTTSAVRADTIIAPTSKINDPSTGTILISVTGSTGVGVSGVTANVTVDTDTANNTGSALDTSSQPSLTNSDGCAVAIKVVPGTYDVTLATASGQNDVDPDQNPTPQKTVTVAAGDSIGVSFSYDAADDYSMTYANYAANYSGTALVPTDLDTTILTTGRTYTAPTPASDQLLYPTSAGYTFLAGTYVPAGGSATSCLSPDPESWPKSSTNKVGQRPAPVAADPTLKAASVQVPMGVTTIAVKSTDKVIQAKTTTAANGDPGCAATQTYNFTKSGNGTSATIALPYGTWAITSGSSTSALSKVTIGSLVGSILGILAPGSSSTNVVTLDPRVN